MTLPPLSDGVLLVFGLVLLYVGCGVLAVLVGQGAAAVKRFIGRLAVPCVVSPWCCHECGAPAGEPHTRSDCPENLEDFAALTAPPE